MRWRVRAGCAGKAPSNNMSPATTPPTTVIQITNDNHQITNQHQTNK
jgi:hypothetical protein